jgi:hypothetical protein
LRIVDRKELAVTVLRGARAAIVCGLAIVFVSVGIAVAGAPEEVVSTPRNEFDGTAEDGYLAYTQSRVAKPQKVDVYLTPPAAPRIKVNAAGTIAFHPNIEIGDVTYGDRLVFAQRASGNTNLKMWDVDAGGRSDLPVNTNAVESKPSLSGTWLLFGRGPASGGGYMTRVILFDLEAETSTVVDQAPTNGIVYPGIVNGDWVSWTECSPTDCNAWRYQISTDTKSEVPSSARLIYTSAVGQDGTVWFMQSGIGCGVNVKLRRDAVDGAPTTHVDFADGVDANVSDLDDSGVTRQLYFDRVRCSNVNNWAVYRVTAD